MMMKYESSYNIMIHSNNDCRMKLMVLILMLSLYTSGRFERDNLDFTSLLTGVDNG